MWFIAFLKNWRYVIFGVLVVVFVIAYDYFRDIYMIKAVKPSNSQCASGDNSTVRKFSLISFGG